MVGAWQAASVQGEGRVARDAAINAWAGDGQFAASLSLNKPGLFADYQLVWPEAPWSMVTALAQAIRRLASLPAWREEVRRRFDRDHAALAGLLDVEPGCEGAMIGLDFHVGAEGAGLGLIEVNTNAGGAYWAAALAEPAQRAGFEAGVIDLFEREWALARAKPSHVSPARPLRTVVIVDDAPTQQFLYEEFLLFRALFRRHGWRAEICDPQELRYLDEGRGGVTLTDGTPVDLVYNRLTDFYFELPEHAGLLNAYRQQATVITPHPLAHALYADKRNLVAWSDPTFLRALPGLSEDDLACLTSVLLPARPVTAESAPALWGDRRAWFFKPRAGYGSRAAYRGDKLTLRVWQEIVARGDYIAQRLMPAGSVTVPLSRDDAEDASAGSSATYKFDWRLYLGSQAEVLTQVTRLYQGQTTNFRTPGGGFAALRAAAAQALR